MATSPSLKSVCSWAVTAISVSLRYSSAMPRYSWPLVTATFAFRVAPGYQDPTTHPDDDQDAPEDDHGLGCSGLQECKSAYYHRDGRQDAHANDQCLSYRP